LVEINGNLLRLIEPGGESISVKCRFEGADKKGDGENPPP
jgi:hypothetical protein